MSNREGIKEEENTSRSNDSKSDDTTLRNEMGVQELHAGPTPFEEIATPEYLNHSSLAPVASQDEPTYSVFMYPAKDLPKSYIQMIYSRWKRSLRTGNKLYKKISSKTFYDQYDKHITMLLSKPDSQVRLAVLSDEPDVCLGFSVSREDVLDYIHVHTDFRRIGIARKLMPAGITTMGQMTATSLIIWQRNEHYKHLKFNPFA